MSNVILCNISDANSIIEETRAEWINDVFDSLHIPDEVFDIRDIQDYRMNMNELGIEVVLYSNGEVDVYKKVWYEEGNSSGWLPAVKENLVAQWKTPERVMRLDEKKSMYYEIHIKQWFMKSMNL